MPTTCLPGEKTITLVELMSIEDTESRTEAIRRAFASYAAPIDVSGSEIAAVVILVNLTHKRSDVDDLLNQELAQNTLRDLKHLRACINEVRWTHTHNLKYPDPRVSGQRLIASMLPMSGFISSAGLMHGVGWAHNSSAVNKAKLFGTSISWYGRICTLADLLIEKQGIWLEILKELGISEVEVEVLCDQLAALVDEPCVPSEVSSYSTQVRFPWQGGYLSITPVVSHAVQCEIQCFRQKRAGGKFTTIRHSHPAMVGSLVASLAGNVPVLFSPPPVRRAMHQSLSQSRDVSLRSGKSLFDVGALYDHEFTQALQHLINLDQQITVSDRRRVQSASLRVVRQKLGEWLFPVVELREDLAEEGQKLPDLTGKTPTLEQKMMSTPLSEWSAFHRELNQALHIQLQSGRSLSRFAFHSKLLRPLSDQLRAASNALSRKTRHTESTKEPCSYLYLGSLRVFDGQALSNPYMVGIPSLTAFWGFLHHYEQAACRLMKQKMEFTGGALFIRSYSLSEGRRLPEPSMLRKTDGRVARPGIIDNRFCDMTLDLIIRVRSSCHEGIDESSVPLLKAALPPRFAGGVIHPPSLYENREWLSEYKNENELFKSLSRLPRSGRWVIPTKETASKVEDLVQLCTMKPELRPAMLGYGFLEEPCQKEGSIEPVHAYAEPLIGLVRCLSPVEFRMKPASYFFSSAFWGMESQERSMLMKKA
jgi:CRISPR-associated protein Csy2